MDYSDKIQEDDNVKKASTERKDKISKIDFAPKENIVYVGVVENIYLSLKEVEEYITNIANDIIDVKNYKMLVLCLDNAVELLFKFIIANREEILLYNGEELNKVLKKYRKAHDEGLYDLESFFCKYPFENDLHTIAFSEACDLLAEYFQIISDEFALKCKKLAQVRNGFIHYSTVITYTDIISYLSIYEKCCELYNQEMDYFRRKINQLVIDEKYINYPINFDMIMNVDTIYRRAICDEIFQNPMYLHIVGFVINNYNSILIEMRPYEYDTIEELFFKEYSKYYNQKEIKKWHQEFKKIYRIMVDANLVYENYEIYDDKLSTLMIVRWLLEVINVKLNEEEQKESLKCDISINELISYMDHKNEEEWWN